MVVKSTDRDVATSENSYGAWGARLSGLWGSDVAGPEYEDTSVRGFTGHEHLDPVGLIHMNGRVYDPELGRFLSPDPYIKDLTNTQHYNRYTYVSNNPLSLTDPTGFTEEDDVPETVEEQLMVTGYQEPALEFEWYNGHEFENMLFDNRDWVGAFEAYGMVQDGEIKIGDHTYTVNHKAGRDYFNRLINRMMAKQRLKSLGARNEQKGQDGVPHRYTVGPTRLCSTDSARCNMNHALDVVNEASVPIVGMFSGDPKDGTMILLGDNPITHVIDRENFTIWNITQEGHDFHPGTVMHRLYIEDGNIMLFTEGLGTGNNPNWNNFVGKLLFGQTHTQAQIKLAPGYRFDDYEN